MQAWILVGGAGLLLLVVIVLALARKNAGPEPEDADGEEPEDPDKKKQWDTERATYAKWKAKQASHGKRALLFAAAIIIAIGVIAIPASTYHWGGESCEETTEVVEDDTVTKTDTETTVSGAEPSETDTTSRESVWTPDKVTEKCSDPPLELTSPMVIGAVALALLVLTPRVSEISVAGLMSLKWKVEAQQREVEATKKETQALQQSIKNSTDVRTVQQANPTMNTQVIVGGRLRDDQAAIDAGLVLATQLDGVIWEFVRTYGIVVAPALYLRRRGRLLAPLDEPTEDSGTSGGSRDRDISLDSGLPAAVAWNTEESAHKVRGSRAQFATPVFDPTGRRLAVLAIVAEIGTEGPIDSDYLGRLEGGLQTLAEALSPTLTHMMGISGH